MGPQASPGFTQPAAACGGAPAVPGDMSMADGDLLRRYIARHGEIPLSTRDVVEWWLESRR